MISNKVFWFDFTNVPHVSFLQPIINHLSSFHHIYTLRDFAETKSLFEKTIAKDFFLIGKHSGSNKAKKVLGALHRIYSLQRNVPQFDIKISVGGDASSIVAKIRNKISITFDDNEKAPNWRYSRFSDLAFWPKAINLSDIVNQGFNAEKVFQYEGFKEDLYIADYIPDTSFLKSLPFEKYVVVRPENMQANYVQDRSGSITPTLLDLLQKTKTNVLFLPRYKNDRALGEGYSNVYMPDSALKGLDVCYFADAVFTGAGTLAREAACLGVPAFSFYAGKELLTVDKAMIDMGWIYFSRDPNALIKRFDESKKRIPDLNRSRLVKQQILNKLDDFLL